MRHPPGDARPCFLDVTQPGLPRRRPPVGGTTAGDCAEGGAVRVGSQIQAGGGWQDVAVCLHEELRVRVVQVPVRRCGYDACR